MEQTNSVLFDKELFGVLIASILTCKMYTSDQGRSSRNLSGSAHHGTERLVRSSLCDCVVRVASYKGRCYEVMTASHRGMRTKVTKEWLRKEISETDWRRESKNINNEKAEDEI
jgi:hypothetical protein